VAQWHPQGITEGQARAQAGLKKSGTWSTYLSRLRSGGLIRAENNLLYVTSEGLEKAGASGHSSPSTTEEVLAIWKPKLSSGARKILDAILARQGQPVSVETIMQETGFAQSGTLSTYLSHLRTAQLIKKEGGGYAANKEVLFL